MTRLVLPRLSTTGAWRGALLAGVFAALLAFSGCGGGVGTEGTGSFASGPISGFGSIVVNGVHYDPAGARIEGDEGQIEDPSALQLGTMVEIAAGAVTVGSDGVSRAAATTVREVRALVGMVSAVDVAASRLTVLGQPVAVSASTVFGDGFGAALASVAVGQAVVVYGDFDSGDGAYQATRIASAPAGGANLLRGPVSSLDTAAKTFTIGGQTYSYAAVADPASLGVGATLRLTLPGAPDPKGRWVVGGAQQVTDPAPADASVDLRGTVDRMLSPTRFVVDNRSVDAASARIDAGLRVGASVHVVGTLAGGVVAASRVELVSRLQSFELIGPITRLDSAARQFVVRATQVGYDPASVVFDQGSAADLALGRVVRVAGVLSADGQTLRATLIRFGN